jgi:uncharacterized glyoxalase superfamily metalloenzyme YdcJ
MNTWSTGQLRAAFARRVAEVYAREVPAYGDLVEVASAVNADVVSRDPDAAQRFGAIARVTAERHGAIRVGTAKELRDVSRIFAAFGMHPVGFYDLRDGTDSPVPVISTAFRPIDAAELDHNPFRMFTSVLVTDDRRFFTADLRKRLDSFLSRRVLFAPELLDLADRAVAAGGLPDAAADRLLTLATASFALSPQPVDRGWYDELGQVSAVAADIGGVTTTHINHLTPRVLDIDELYRRMTARGVQMIDTIQGPPRWDGPLVLLRQTSFRALAESRRFTERDGSVTDGQLSVRFGEVEARGVALTRAGRERYDDMLVEVDRRLAESPGSDRADVARTVWAQRLPSSESGLREQGLAYFSYDVVAGEVVATPIVYEDFLPRSAAGIFASNLTSAGTRRDEPAAVTRDVGWLSDVIGSQVADPFELYEAEQSASLVRVSQATGQPYDGP